MKLNCKRIDFTYTPGEEIFTFPEDTGLPFLFDVEEELTDNPCRHGCGGRNAGRGGEIGGKGQGRPSKRHWRTRTAPATAS